MGMSGVHVVISLMPSSNRFESGLCSNLSLAFFRIRSEGTWRSRGPRVECPGRIFGTIGAASPPTSTTRSAQPPSSYPLLYTRPSSSIFKLQAPPLLAFYLLIQPVPMQVSPEQLSKLEHTLLSQTEPLHNRFRALFTLKAVGGSEAIRIVAEGASAV